jgi:hypothetical protein
MKPTRIWESIDNMAGAAAVLAEWRMLTGDDYENFRAFLYPDEKPALDYPCIHPQPCRCRHEIIHHADGKLSAACCCEPPECKSLTLKKSDILLYSVSIFQVAEATRLAFGLERGYERFNPFWRETETLRFGEIGIKKHSAFLICGQQHDELLHEIDRLLGIHGDFFLIFTPTSNNHSQLIRSKLRRNGCDIVALSETLELQEGQSFRAVQDIEPVLAGIGKPGAATARTEKIVTDLHQKISVVETGLQDVKKEVIEWRADYREVQSAKARLEKMQADGLMKFTAKVDGKSFHVLCAIIACGDVAKASRELKMGDSTVRDIIRSWKKLGPSYAVMSDLVKWRKRVGGKYTVPFNDALLYEKEATTGSNENVFSDLLDAVLSMTESNWQDICAELESTLKNQLSK